MDFQSKEVTLDSVDFFWVQEWVFVCFLFFVFLVFLNFHIPNMSLIFELSNNITGFLF